MSRVRFVFLVLVSALFSCERKITEEEFEQEVFTEIFSRVVDSTYKDKRLYTSFPKSGEDHKITIQALKNDTLNLIIAIGKGGLINDETELQHYNSGKFTFKHLSELPADYEYENWTAKYPKFAGVLVFSNIKFDDTKEQGFLDVSYYCGLKCGLGYKVTIKKVDDKWVISKVDDTWIS